MPYAAMELAVNVRGQNPAASVVLVADNAAKGSFAKPELVKPEIDCRPQAHSGLSSTARSGAGESSLSIGEAYGREVSTFALEDPGYHADEDSKDAEDLRQAGQPPATASEFACSFMLANTIMGMGMLGLPTVCAATGIFWFVVLMTVACSTSCFTVHLMATASEQAREKAFVALGEAAFGRVGATGATIVMIGQTFCTMTAYIVLLKDEVPDLFFQGNKDYVAMTVIFIALAITPLCLLTDISRLKPACYFAVSIFFTVILSVLFSAVTADHSHLGPAARAAAQVPVNIWEMRVMEALKVMPGAIFAFVCHHTALPIYASLRGGHPALMDKVALKAFALVLTLYCVCGIGGYIAFRDMVLLEKDPSGTGKNPMRANVIKALPPQTFFLGLRMCMIFAVLLGYPCVHFSSRKAVMTAIFGRDGEWTWVRHVGVSIGILGITVGLALTCPGLEFVFKWGGSTVSILMAFMFPSACFLGTCKWLPTTDNIGVRLSYAVVCLGAIMMITCITANLMS